MKKNTPSQTLRHFLCSVGALGLVACGLPADPSVSPLAGDPGDRLHAGIGTESLLPTDPPDETAVSGRPPALTRIDPALGPDTGYVDITLTGRNFRPGATVQFAGTSVGSVTVLSSTQLKVSLPAKPGSLGRVPVRITLPDGRFVERNDLFAYYSDDMALRPPRVTPLSETSQLSSGTS